ncbi:MAG TPA: hypothetical protein VKB79_30100 [Bryobacteraceae bacterium]|nr:hypothetical protein [Bryobacteraceae bacterium]
MLGRRHVAAILLTINGTRAASAQFHASVGVGLTWGRGPVTAPPLSLEQLTEASPERTEGEAVRKVAVLMHIAARNPSSALLDHGDVDSLVAMLRAIAYHRGIQLISVCAFNLDQEKILFDRSISGDFEVEALENGIRSLKPGTIDYSLLMAQSAGASSFLGDVLARGDSQQPDAVIILGSQASRSIRSRRVDSRVPTDRPLFYLRYAPGPVSNLNLWNDPIRDTVHARKGGLYDIHQPADFWRAWTAIESTLGLGPGK